MGIPVAICLGISVLIFIYGLNIASSTIPTLIFGSISPFALMVPLFILKGCIVQKIGVLESLVNLFDLLVGYIPGGLAHKNILVSIFLLECPVQHLLIQLLWVQCLFHQLRNKDLIVILVL